MDCPVKEEGEGTMEIKHTEPMHGERPGKERRPKVVGTTVGTVVDTSSQYLAMY